MSEGEILVLEDEALIAMDIEMTLQEAGYQKVSVHSDSKSALKKIENTQPIAAFLDFNLGNDKTSLDVANALKDRGVPFVFLTGYTDATVSLPDDLADVKRIAKPFQGAELVKAVNGMISEE